MTDKIKLKPCPFRGATALGIDHERVDDEMSPVWASCLGRTAQGPLAYDGKTAAWLWNSRRERKDEEVDECQPKD